MTDEQMNKFAGDRSQTVGYEIRISTGNGRLDPAQRRAIANAALKAARMVQVQMMLAVPDHVVVDMVRRSSTIGATVIPLEDT